MAGGEYVGFNNPSFLSMKGAADRDFALAYFMKENKVSSDWFILPLNQCHDRKYISYNPESKGPRINVD